MPARQSFYDTERYWAAVSKNGSDKLLTNLRQHHDFNVPAPDPTVIAKRPKLKLKPVKPKHWFSIVEDHPTEPRISDVKKAACQYFEVTSLDLDSARRTLKIVYPRHIAMYLARQVTGRSYPEIGRRFGNRDHTTVLSGIRKIERLRKTDSKLDADIQALTKILEGGSLG